MDVISGNSQGPNVSRSKVEGKNFPFSGTKEGTVRNFEFGEPIIRIVYEGPINDVPTVECLN